VLFWFGLGMARLERDAVKVALEKITSSALFRNSERRNQLLRYTVERALAGEQSLKEYTLGVEVFRKPESYDPRLDPIVRVEFGRVRQKLKEYYDSDGRNDPVRIEYPPRSYLPTFSTAPPATATATAAVRRATWIPLLALNRAAILALLGAIVLAAAGGGWVYHLRRQAAGLSEADRQLYWNAQFLLDDRSPPHVTQAIAAFEQLAQKKPESALAWAGLAKAYGVTAANDLDDPMIFGPKARAAADRALHLAPGLAEGHSASALVKSFYEWDWSGSDEEYRRAIVLNPSLAEAHLGWAMSLLVRERFNEATAEAMRAVALEPGSFANRRGLAIVYFYSGRYGDALEECRTLLRSNPQAWVHGFMSVTYEKIHQEADRILEAQRQVALPETTRADMRFVLNMNLGRKAEARREFERLLEESKHHYVSPLTIANASGMLGNRDGWDEWIETAYRRHDCALVWLKLYEGTDPHLQKILAKMGLRDAPAATSQVPTPAR
jgi:tetratricopeptide (TPR) repeat protein